MDAASVNYLRLPAEDVETDNIIMIFEQIVNFIENGRNAQQNGDKKFGVLVFCDEGVSRSPTAAIAYLLSRGWTLKSAVKHLNSEWPKVCIICRLVSAAAAHLLTCRHTQTRASSTSCSSTKRRCSSARR